LGLELEHDDWCAVNSPMQAQRGRLLNSRNVVAVAEFAFLNAGNRESTCRRRPEFRHSPDGWRTSVEHCPDLICREGSQPFELHVQFNPIPQHPEGTTDESEIRWR
jgi:hypothetical protein